MNNQTPPARTTSTQRATPPIQAPPTRIVSPATIDDNVVSIGENLPPIETAFPAALNINTRGKLMTWAMHHRRHACRNETKLQGESMAKE